MRRASITLMCGAAGSCIGAVAHAQTAEPVTDTQGHASTGAEAGGADRMRIGSATPDAVGDIIVTAQKRSERLQDVPVSITAATGEQLKTLGVTTPDQLEHVAPGFSVSKSLYGLPVFFLRGVGFNDPTLGVSPAVAVYTDQLPVPYSAMTRGTALDLERVEVLKGPQGTLFGQNTTGGAVNFIAAKPTSDLKAGFDLTYGRFDEVDAEAFISGPISDTLSARLAVRNEYRGDWQRGYTISQSIGEKQFHNARLLVDWKPADRIKVELSATGWQDKSDTQQPQYIRYDPAARAGGRDVPLEVQTFPPAPNNARAAAWDPQRRFAQDNWFYQFGGRIDVELSDAVALTSLTSYSRYEQSLPTDFDATTYPAVVSTDTGRIHSFSQELRLSGALADGGVKWIAGANYQSDRVNERLIQDPVIATSTSIGPLTFDSFIVDNDQKVKTKAVFGSVDVKLTSTLIAQGSVRYTDQDRDFAGCTRDPGNGQVARAVSLLATLVSQTPQTIAPGACITLSPAGLPSPIITNSLDQNNVSWRGSLNWKVTPDTLVYGNVTKGYKSGSFPTNPAPFSPSIDPISQESVLAFEVGSKATTMHRLLQVEAAAFYYRYNDKQLLGYVVVPPLGAIPSLVSIPRTSVKGAEFSVRLGPISGLSLSAGGTYVHTRVDRNPINPTGAFGNTADLRGQPFPNTPKWQGVADAQYRFAASGSLSAYVGSSLTLRSSAHGVLFSGDPAVAAREAALRLPGYILVDVRAGLETADGTWRLEAWGRNVTNKFYLIGAQRAADNITRFTGMPATYGLSLFYRY